MIKVTLNVAQLLMTQRIKGVLKAKRVPIGRVYLITYRVNVYHVVKISQLYSLPLFLPVFGGVGGVQGS